MGWWKTAKPGDFVVCVEGYDTPCKGATPVVKGCVYQIREIFVVGEDFKEAGEVAVRLAGHNNGTSNSGAEGAWRPKLFRPVKPLHTSLTDCLRAPVSPWGQPTKERV